MNQLPVAPFLCRRTRTTTEHHQPLSYFFVDAPKGVAAETLSGGTLRQFQRGRSLPPRNGILFRSLPAHAPMYAAAIAAAAATNAVDAPCLPPAAEVAALLLGSTAHPGEPNPAAAVAPVAPVAAPPPALPSNVW